MAVDFHQVREQVRQLGENAAQRAHDLQDKRQKAAELLASYANDARGLCDKVTRVVRHHDPNLRCALPAMNLGNAPEPLNAHFPLPALPPNATILAADGSQIAPDRHQAVNYSLINVGSIQMHLGSPDSPRLTVESTLLYDEMLSSGSGILSEASLALKRDLSERSRLLALAEGADPPVITFTDGPMELWGSREVEGEGDFRKSLDAYLKVLKRLEELVVATAGYVDKPAANLVVRLLEVAMLPEDKLSGIRMSFPLSGVVDRLLFQDLLGPGERSAVFALQSRSAAKYQEGLALHFFYLNVGRPKHPWPVRVEIPAWVAGNCEMLDSLHAALIDQCRIMGNRPYPYLLHRAHEAAVVTLEEKDQITQMILLELRNRKVEIGEVSYKQSAKDSAGRTRFER